MSRYTLEIRVGNIPDNDEMDYDSRVAQICSAIRDLDPKYHVDPGMGYPDEDVCDEEE